MAGTVADLVTIVSGRDALPREDRPDPLVAAARAGDRAAFGQLVELHEGAALRTAMAALGRREDADDVVQDAFVIAWQRLPGFRGDASFRTWVLTIVWRRALDRRKARNRWWHRTAAWTPNELDTRANDDGVTSPERRAIDLDARRAVHRAIASLSPKLRDALLLAAGGEHTYDEIARLLGVQTGTVKWRVSQARRLIRADLQRGSDR